MQEAAFVRAAAACRGRGETTQLEASANEKGARSGAPSAASGTLLRDAAVDVVRRALVEAGEDHVVQ
ncbi:MAG: hypothetical protein ACREIR_03210, partial [Geminicoccaceae bacterium]